MESRFSENTGVCKMGMEKKMKNTRKVVLYRGLTALFIALAVLVGSVRSVALSWTAKVNELMGVSGSSVTRSTEKEDYIYPSDYDEAADLVSAEIGIATRIEEEGAVLLKGDAAVSGTNITLFGMRSHDMQYGGTMGGLTSLKETVSFEDALAQKGFSVNPTMIEFYESMEANYTPGNAAGVAISDTNTGTTVNEVPVSEYTSTQESSYSDYSDAAVIVLGRDSSEGADYYPGEDGIANPDEFSESLTGNILGLSDDERDLINYVTEQGFSKVIVLLNSVSTMEIEEIKTNDAVDSILWIGDPGAYGTLGIANILNGSVVPSGHLADTYAVNTALSPAAQNFGAYVFENDELIDTSSNNELRARWYLAETESIYTGYRYYETRYYDSVVGAGKASLALNKETVDGSITWDYDNEVSYAFGYGIEGSTFTEEIVDTSIDWTGNTDSSVTVKVTNTGDTAAKHVVQLYVSLPYTEYDIENAIEKSAVQLVGYAKTGEADEADYSEVNLLAPGESEEVVVTFNTEYMRTYDQTYAHDDTEGAYILEEGDYVFATGNGSHDAVQAVLKEQYPDLMADAEPTGTTFTETISELQAFTEANGTLIENELQDADLNNLGTGTEITYLTRSNWAETFPQEVESITATDEMIVLLQNAVYDSEEANEAYDGETSWEYEQDLGIVIEQLTGLDYDDPLYDQILSEVSLEDMYKTYITTDETILSIGLPKAIGSDSPLGIIGALGKYTAGTYYEVTEDSEYYLHETNVYESETVVASTFGHLLASEEGRIIGNDSVWTQVSDWNAPGANIHRSPYNARNYEYYAEDPILSGYMATDVISNAREYGIRPIMKHFAFNDQETNRDGVAVFISEQAAREVELRSFQIPVENCEGINIMTAFNRIGCTHVGQHTGLMIGILRGEFGLTTGVVETDSLKSAKYFLPNECLVAGNDIMLGGANSAGLWGISVETYENDVYLQSLLRESYHRVLYSAANSNRINGITVENISGSSEPVWQVVLMILTCGFAFAATLFLILWIIFMVKNRAEVKVDEK